MVAFLTSTYQQFSEPKAIEKLQSFKNIEVRLYDQVIEGGLHAKGYLFMKGDYEACLYERTYRPYPSGGDH